MLNYRELMEKKYRDVGKPGSSVKEFEKDAHSQGIDLGDAERDAHHIKYPNARYRKGGKPVKDTLISGELSGNRFNSYNHTHGNTLRDAVKASGRKKPNTPAQKEAIRKQAAENKAKKAKHRDPFTREHSEWWLNMWRIDEAMDGEQEKARRVKQMAKPKPGAPVGGTRSTISAARPSNTVKKPDVSKPVSGGSVKTASPGLGMPGSLSTQRSAADAAGKATAAKASADKAKRDRAAAFKPEQQKAAAAAKSLERDVRTGSNRPQSRPPSANKSTERTRAGGGALKVRTPDDERRAKAMSVQSKRDAQEREAKRPQAQPPRRPGQAEAERKARDKRVDGIRNKKTNKQMAQLNRDKQGPGGQLKSMAGGEMFIRDKKTDTKQTRDKKSAMRNKARGDFTKKKVQQTGNFVKSLPGKALSVAKPTVEYDSVPDSKADKVTGSKEIIRGKRA